MSLVVVGIFMRIMTYIVFLLCMHFPSKPLPIYDASGFLVLVLVMGL